MSKIEPLDDEEAENFERIVNLPIRATSDFYLLGDVKSFQEMNEKFVNMIFAIRQVNIFIFIQK